MKKTNILFLVIFSFLFFSCSFLIDSKLNNNQQEMLALESNQSLVTININKDSLSRNAAFVPNISNIDENIGLYKIEIVESGTTNSNIYDIVVLPGSSSSISTVLSYGEYNISVYGYTNENATIVDNDNYKTLYTIKANNTQTIEASNVELNLKPRLSLEEGSGLEGAIDITINFPQSNDTTYTVSATFDGIADASITNKVLDCSSDSQPLQIQKSDVAVGTHSLKLTIKNSLYPSKTIEKLFNIDVYPNLCTDKVYKGGSFESDFTLQVDSLNPNKKIGKIGFIIHGTGATASSKTAAALATEKGCEQFIKVTSLQSAVDFIENSYDWSDTSLDPVEIYIDGSVKQTAKSGDEAIITIGKNDVASKIKFVSYNSDNTKDGIARDSTPLVRVFYINKNATVNIEDLSITSGNTSSLTDKNGGAIYCSGRLIAKNVAISGSSAAGTGASAGIGDCIYCASESNVILEDCNMKAMSGREGKVGIYVASGISSFVLKGSTYIFNIQVQSPATITLDSVATISGNTTCAKVTLDDYTTEDVILTPQSGSLTEGVCNLFELADDNYKFYTDGKVHAKTSPAGGGINSWEELCAQVDVLSSEELVEFEITNNLIVTRCLENITPIKLVANSPYTIKRSPDHPGEFFKPAANLEIVGKDATNRLTFDGGSEESTPIAATASLIKIESNNQMELKLSNCDFNNNGTGSGGFSGGAISVHPATGEMGTKQVSLDIENCYFENNNVSIDGGAIYIAGGTDVGDSSFTNCRFTDNYATENGGALCIEANSGKITLYNTHISSNVCGFSGQGAGIYLEKGTLCLESSTNVGSNKKKISGSEFNQDIYFVESKKPSLSIGEYCQVGVIDLKVADPSDAFTIPLILADDFDSVSNTTIMFKDELMPDSGTTIIKSNVDISGFIDIFELAEDHIDAGYRLQLTDDNKGIQIIAP